VFLSLTIQLTRIRNETLIVSSVLLVSLKTTTEKSEYDVRNISDRRTHFVLVRRKIWIVTPVGDEQCGS
jgi:hypothetical protein